MGILFIIALLLAWPTFGLSIVVWLILVFFKSKAKVEKIDRRREIVQIIEPLFQGRFSEFFMAMDIPLIYGQDLTQEEAHKCGRHIMNYIAHNPSEAALFMNGLDRWRTKGSSELCDPITAARDEKNLNAKREIHVTSYRAIEAIMTNNYNLPCFRKIDFPLLVEYRACLEEDLAG